jgi:hypothetical protein
MPFGRDEMRIIRQQRRLARAEIGEDDAALLRDRIGKMLDLLLVAALRRLGRLLRALAVNVEDPAV